MSKIIKSHQERFPDEVFSTKVRVPELNDEEVPFSMFKFLQWKHDPWLWMTEQVYTMDESDGTVKPFPPFQYLRLIVQLYFQNKIIIIPKTRRQLQTHTFFSGVLPHQFLFKDKSDNIFVSISEAKAKKAFRRRARHTLQNLDMRFGFYPNLKEGAHLLSQSAINPDTGSELSSIPSGADKCRGDTITNAIYDEFAFQTHCEENLAALKPALEGKDCRAAIISSPLPGTKFEELTKIKEGSQFKELMQGLSITDNEFNHLVIKCHYKAHPYKRTIEWYYKERYGTTPDGVPIPGESGVDTFTWLQEYEGEFNFPKGDRAIWEYDETLHCQPYHELYPNGYDNTQPLYISFDFGSNFPAVTFSQPDTFNRFVIHDGLMVYRERLSAFIIRTLNFLDEHFDGWRDDYKIFCDPSGFKGARDGNADPGGLEVEKEFKKRVTNRNKTCKPIEGIYALNDLCANKIGQSHQLIVNPSAGRFINEVGKEEYGVIPKAFMYGYTLKDMKHMSNRGYKGQLIEVEKDGFHDHFMDTVRWVVQWRWKSRKQRDEDMEARKAKKKRPKPMRRSFRV